MMFSLWIFVFLLFIMSVSSQIQPGESVSREELESLKSRMQSQEIKIHALEVLLKTKQDRIPLISFMASFKNDPVPMKYSNGQIVIFDNVYLNDGNGYISHSGMFRAPVSGLYLFTLNIYASSSEMEFKLVKDGSEIAWLVSTVPGGTESVQTVVHLHKDQEMWVMKFWGGDTLRGKQLSTFSGFLLRTDDDNFHAPSVVG
ncbi:complement C1q tumor necrosis factor-related protein 3-like [Gigantopelta aegis]|uniref:complement C1q tumor necrosis factor-related protein 3-like n=1 Tax=Gigantopelta aegis TaxID=1735272 RepID=UPI001B888444|nr:complement C1q tumor necrosis factor-related protein 3-like [Gigantopelta aegis]